MLEIRDLHVQFHGADHEAVRGIDLTVGDGEIVGLVGESGSGKTVTAMMISGLLRPEQAAFRGQILLDGRDARTLDQRALAAHIAYIPQIHRPTFGYSVLDTVLMGLTRQLSPFRSPSAQQEGQAVAALEQLGVSHLAPRSFSELSGGEQQLVLIARALCQQADILVMDEPTSSLDYGNQLRVLRCVKTLARRGYTVILSTHDPQHALRFADRVLALSGGGVAAFGAAKDILTAELLRRLYGVDAALLETEHGPAIVPKGGVDDVPLDG